MQASISMAHALLQQGQELWKQDRYEEATRVLSRLLSLRVISPKVAERARFYLGDIELAQGHYVKARRHLAAAMATGTDHGETHFLMACALDWDEKPDLRRASQHYRQAVELEPGQPLYSSAYALARIRQKRSKRDPQALRRLRDAFAAQPDDPDIVYNYISGLLELGRLPEADIAIRRARRRWPAHPAFEELWCDFLGRRGVLRTRRETAPPVAPRLRLLAEEPVILSFPRRGSAPSPRKPARSDHRLDAALESLGAEELGALAVSLGLPVDPDSTRQRRRVARALRDRVRLGGLVARLSPDGRQLMRMLLSWGGAIELKRITLRVDGPAQHGPHFGAARRVRRPFDELRRSGLVFTRRMGESGPEMAVVPSDLHEALGEFLDDPGDSPSPLEGRGTA